MHNIFGLSFIPLFALAACATETNEPTKRARNIATNVNQNNGAIDTTLRDSMLRSHNAARAEVNVPPLSWDTGLTNLASNYAQKLADEDIFEHDPQTGINPRHGENLWKGTKATFTYVQMSGAWVNEKSLYKDGVFPNVVTKGHWSAVGHYTQIIWGKTMYVGCAIASNRRDDFLVCRYSPAGNVIGQRPTKL